MRFTAYGQRNRTRIQFTVEAEDEMHARKAAEAYAARIRMTLADVARDYASVRILDGEISVLTDVFDGIYERLA